MKLNKQYKYLNKTRKLRKRKRGGVPTFSKYGELLGRLLKWLKGKPKDDGIEMSSFESKAEEIAKKIDEENPKGNLHNNVINDGGVINAIETKMDPDDINVKEFKKVVSEKIPEITMRTFGKNGTQKSRLPRNNSNNKTLKKEPKKQDFSDAERAKLAAQTQKEERAKQLKIIKRKEDAARKKKEAEDALADALEKKKQKQEEQTKAAAIKQEAEKERLAKIEAETALLQKKKEEEAAAVLLQKKKEEDAAAVLLQKKKEEDAAAALLQKKKEEEAAAALLQKKKEEEAAAALLQKKKEEEAAAALLQKKKEEEAAAALLQKKKEEEAAAALLQKKKEEEAAAALLKKNEEEAAAALLKKNEEEAAAALLKKKEEEAAAALLQKKKEEEAAAALLKNKQEEEAALKKQEEESALKQEDLQHLLTTVSKIVNAVSMKPIPIPIVNISKDEITNIIKSVVKIVDGLNNQQAQITNSAKDDVTKIIESASNVVAGIDSQLSHDELAEIIKSTVKIVDGINETKMINSNDDEDSQDTATNGIPDPTTDNTTLNKKQKDELVNTASNLLTPSTDTTANNTSIYTIISEQKNKMKPIVNKIEDDGKGNYNFEQVLPDEAEYNKVIEFDKQKHTPHADSFVSKLFEKTSDQNPSEQNPSEQNTSTNNIPEQPSNNPNTVSN